MLNSYLKGENNNPKEILYDIQLDLSSFFLILTQDTSVKKGKYSAQNIVHKRCKCQKCMPQKMEESAEFHKKQAFTFKEANLNIRMSNSIIPNMSTKIKGSFL